MSLTEVILFRLPQQVQYNFFGRLQKIKKFKASKIKINKYFKQNNYSHSNSLKILNKFNNNTRFSFFKCDLDLTTSINWLKDYKNNKTSKQEYYGNIDRQNFNKIGDIKYIFEPSRFYFLPFLALKATTLNKNQEYIKLIYSTLYGWKKQNPYLLTVHWTSGIEIGIRSINLVYTHMVLNSTRLLNNETDCLIKELIQYNYHFLKHHLSLYSSANNHLVAELSGLVVISNYFNSKEFVKNRAKWNEKLFIEIENQVNSDGVHMELSTHYHAEVTDHFLNALMFIKRGNNEVPKSVERKMKSMFKFLNHVEYENVSTLFGDSDDGFLVNPYFDKDFSIYESLLHSSDIVYKTNYKNSEKIDLRNFLIFGSDVKNCKEDSVVKYNDDEIFLDSGYVFCYDNKAKAKFSMDFGQIGDNISSAHGHSDILHFTLDIKGIQILVDSGTYQYHSKYKSCREYFRGISAHNTISINGLDHAVQNNRMSWINKPKVNLLNYKLSNILSSLEAQTDAFKKENIIHRRKFVFDKENQIIKIIDKLIVINEDFKKRKMKFYLNFSNEVKLKHDLNKIIVESKDLKLIIENALFNLGNIIQAKENDCTGWRSKKYDTKIKGRTFLLKLETSEGIEMETKISY